MSVARKLAAEGLGTAFLLAAVVGSGIMGERLSGGNVAIALLANTIATGARAYYVDPHVRPYLGSTSQPAVTLADASQGGLGWREVPGYLVAQVLGAFAGVAAAHLMFGEPLYSASQHVRDVRAGGAQLFSEICRYVRATVSHLGLCAAAPRGSALRSGSVHHRSLLVYGIDFVCESRSHPRQVFY